MEALQAQTKAKKLLNRVKEKLYRSKLARVGMSAILVMGLIPAAAAAAAPTQPEVSPQAQETQTISDLLGVSRDDFLNYLEANKNSYLGTVYKYDWPYPTVYQTGPWWSNGNHPYESEPFNGVSGYGLNCAGFIARVWCDMGLENTDFMNQWYYYHDWKWANSESMRRVLESYNVEQRQFSSIEEMLGSGYLEKGDIVQMESASGSEDHVGIFWGNNSSENAFWHSIYDKGSTTSGTNRISDIYSKSDANTFHVFKFEKRGWFKLWKQPTNKDVAKDNPCYSLNGAQFAIYKNSKDAQNDTNRIYTMTTKAHPDWNNDEWSYAESCWLKPGNYWVREVVAPQGYDLSNEIKSVEVKEGESAQTSITFTDPNKLDPLYMFVRKVDSETGKPVPQGNASLAEAQFTVKYYKGMYSETNLSWIDSTTPDRTWVFKTDEYGQARFEASYKVSGDALYYGETADGGTSPMMPIGTVTVQETKAPAGYLLGNQPIYAQQITEQDVLDEVHADNALIDADIREVVVSGGLAVQKIDSKTGTTPQGNANFEGIVFEVINDNANAVHVGGKNIARGKRILTLTTNANGYAATAPNALPYGDYIVREVSTNNTMLKTAADIKVSVRENGKVYSVKARNEVVRGGVMVTKHDKETNDVSPLGSALLDGTQFEIKTLSENPVVVGNTTYKKGEVVATIESKNGIAQTERNALPYGKYVLTEVQAGDGYFESDVTPYEFSITQNGLMVNATGGHAIANQVKRGDLEFVKVNEHTMARLANVPFKLTSQTTGESHVLVTDENGYASTAANWNPHTQNTNANDNADESSFDNEAGIWFGVDDKGNKTQANNALGALPYDTYTLEELPCSANEGLILISVPNITIKRDSYKVDLGTLDDKEPVTPYLATQAFDATDEDKAVFADSEVAIVDVVSYGNVEVGKTYTMEACLVDKATGTEIAGSRVSQEFTPTYSHSSLEMNLVADLSEYAGSRVVVYEYLYLDGRVVADHADIADSTQTLRVLTPEIGTTLVDGVDADKNVSAEHDIVLVDTVAYTNLVPGKEYTLTGTLMDKATGEPFVDALGNAVVATTTFTPEQATGSVDVTFVFDGSLVDEQTDVVAFETLERDGHEVAVHTDINDEGQTVTLEVPEIGTTLVDGVDADKNVSAEHDIVLVDTVAYTNLVPGKEYTLTGTLMDKATGEPFVDALGNAVVATTTFTPEQATGSVDVTFVFDGSLVDEQTDVVAFETLERDGHEVAVHTDINDEGQTVTLEVPEIGTTLVDGVDADKNVSAEHDIVLVDTVAYTNLVPGKEYTLTGTLMDKATGEPFVDALGNAVVATTTFTPEQATGSVDVTFVFDGSLVDEQTDVVAFETLERDGHEVAVHTDINDEGQTVTLEVPEIGTQATDKADGDKTLAPQEQVTIVDTVAYTNLVPGKEYTLTGTLMDKATGSELMVDGESVVATTTFTPESSSGETEVEFTFNATYLAGKEIVVFETLERDGHEVAVHTDINDEGQTVTVDTPETPTPPTTPETPANPPLVQTGDSLLMAVITIVIFAIGVAGGVSLYASRKSGKNGSNKEQDSENKRE